MVVNGLSAFGAGGDETTVPPVPATRPRLEPGRMLVYRVECGKKIPLSSEIPQRIYVSSGELRDPGPWGNYGFTESQKVSRAPKGGRYELIVGGGEHQDKTHRMRQLGVHGYLRPALYGFSDANGYPQVRCFPFLDYEFGWVDGQDDGDGPSFKGGALWEVRGREIGSARGPKDATGRESVLHHETPARYVFDSQRGYVSEIELHRVLIGGDSLNWAPDEGVDLKFSLDAVTEFPPRDLDARIQDAIRRGSLYLAAHASELERAPWFNDFRVGTRSVVAWALLRARRNDDVANGLLVQALETPLLSTLDAALLILALGALSDSKTPVLASGELRAPNESGKTRVRLASPLDDEARVRRAVAAAAQFLLAGRAKGIGLWGYLPTCQRCEKPKTCVHTYCNVIQGPTEPLVDVMNTFWALDALEVARGLGVKIPPDALRQAVLALEKWGHREISHYIPCVDRAILSSQYSKDVERIWLERLTEDQTLRYTRVVGDHGWPWNSVDQRRLHCVETSMTMQKVAGWGPECPLSIDRYVPALNLSNWPPINLKQRHTGSTGYHNTTLGGVGALARAYSALGQNPFKMQTVLGGLHWARLHFWKVFGSCDIPKGSDFDTRYGGGDVRYSNSGPGDLSYNFLLMERVLDHLGIKELGYHDWYPLLALHALDFQEADGGWHAWRGDRLVPTALMLLFLCRSQETEALDELPAYKPGPAETGEGAKGGRGTGSLIEGEPGTWHRGDEVIASLRKVSDAKRLDLAKRVLEMATEEEKASFVPSLVRAWQRGPAASRSLAEKALRDITKLKSASPDAWLKWHVERQPANGRVGERNRGQAGDQ